MLVIAFIILAIGGGINFGVACALAYWQPAEHNRTLGTTWTIDIPTIDAEIRDRISLMEQWPDVLRRMKLHSAEGWGWSRREIYADTALISRTQVFVELRQMESGWPLPCFSGEYCRIHGSSGETQFYRSAIKFGEQTPTTATAMGDLSIMPLGLKPGPFLVNTALYCAALPLPIVTFFASRKLLRRHRKQCLKCGYPRGASSVCTECGNTHTTRP